MDGLCVYCGKEPSKVCARTGRTCRTVADFRVPRTYPKDVIDPNEGREVDLSGLDFSTALARINAESE